MENNTSVWEKLCAFFRKYAWLMAIVFAVFAILFTLLPVVNYEVREKVLKAGATDVEKLDYEYGVNLITYMTSGFKLNYTFFITLGILLGGIILVILSQFKKDLLTAAGIAFLLAMCMFILAKFFFEAEENEVMKFAKTAKRFTTWCFTIMGRLSWHRILKYRICMHHIIKRKENN